MVVNRSGFRPVGFLAADTPLMIILAAWLAGDTTHFPIIAIKGKPITHTATPTITIQAVPGMGTIIRMLIAIIGIHILTIAITGGFDKPGTKSDDLKNH